MAAFVALFKGVNVGGHNKLPMAALRTKAAAAGLRDVRSYLASGNLVFWFDGTVEEAEARVRAASELDVAVLVIAADRFRDMAASCPFAPSDPRHVHAAFLLGAPKLDADLIARLAGKADEVQLHDGVMWIHTPDGFGTSKLGTALEKIAGVAVTARNLRTVTKLVEMLDATACDC